MSEIAPAKPLISRIEAALSAQILARARLLRRFTGNPFNVNIEEVRGATLLTSNVSVSFLNRAIGAGLSQGHDEKAQIGELIRRFREHRRPFQISLGPGRIQRDMDKERDLERELQKQGIVRGASLTTMYV